MKQEAPDPVELREIVTAVSYKQGWSFELTELDRGQGSVGLTLIIGVSGVDSYDETRPLRVNHYMIVPAASYDRRSWLRWVFEQVLLVERHEAMEFFKVEGSRPFAPNHAPGHDPYVVRDIGTLEDAQTDQRGVRRDVSI